MSSSVDSKGDEKTSPEKQCFSSKVSLKRPYKFDEQNGTSRKFMPTQVLNKARRTTKDGTYTERLQIRTIKEIIPTLDTESPGKASPSSSSSSLDTSLEESDTSSLYFTPDSKSTPVKTPDGSFTKRSIYDQFKDVNHSTPVSSVDRSVYYTPERSPREFDSEIKRKKSRWSDSSNLISLSDSNSSCFLNGSFANSEPDGDIQPELIGYQMVGDSQFCRFGQQLLGLQRVPAPNSPGRIGICVSGQTISELHKRVMEKFYPISDKVVLMIGTNDFLRSKDVMTMCQELSHLISTLQETTSNIVLLTLPPIPKLEHKYRSQHFMMLDQYNRYIRSLEDGDRIRIADISPLYMSSPPFQRCRMYLFETHFAGAARRLDMIHLNRNGLDLIRKYLLEHFL